MIILWYTKFIKKKMQHPTSFGVIVILWMVVNFIRNIDKERKVSFVFVVKKIDIKNQRLVLEYWSHFILQTPDEP